MSARQVPNRSGGWLGARRSILAFVGALLLAACTGTLEDGCSFECAIED